MRSHARSATAHARRPAPGADWLVSVAIVPCAVRSGASQGDSLGPYDTKAMTLFDYRTDHLEVAAARGGAAEKAALKDAETRPSFMYVMPEGEVEGGCVRAFFEETSLVGRAHLAALAWASPEPEPGLSCPPLACVVVVVRRWRASARIRDASPEGALPPRTSGADHPAGLRARGGVLLHPDGWQPAGPRSAGEAHRCLAPPCPAASQPRFGSRTGDRRWRRRGDRAPIDRLPAVPHASIVDRSGVDHLRRAEAIRL